MKTEASRVFSDISREVQTLTKRLISEELDELTSRIETTLSPGVTPTMEDMFQALLKDPIWLTIVTHIQKTVEDSCDALKSDVTDSLIELQEDVCIQILSENADSRSCESSNKAPQIRHVNEKGRGRNSHVRSKRGDKNDGSKHSPKRRCSTPTPSSTTPGYSEPWMDETWYARHIGRRIKVFWPKDRQWYHGRIGEYIAEKKKCVVNYDDGDREELDLSKERFTFLSPNVPKSHSSVALLASAVHKPGRKNQRSWQKNPEDGLIIYPNKKRKFSSKSESDEVGSSLKLLDLTEKSRKTIARPKDRTKTSKIPRKNSKHLKKPKQEQAIPTKKTSQHNTLAPQSPQFKKSKEENKEKSKELKHEENMKIEVSIAPAEVRKVKPTSTLKMTVPSPLEEVKDGVIRSVAQLLTVNAVQAPALQPPPNSLDFIDWIRKEGQDKVVDSRVAAFIGNSWKDGIVASLNSFTLSDPSQEISILLDLEGDETIHKVEGSLVRIQPPASCPNILIGGCCQAKDIDEWFDGQVDEIRQGVKEPVVKVMFVIPDDQRVYQWFKSSLIRMLPLPIST